MSKKKRFGISEALTRGLSETINVVENNAGVYRNVMLPLSRIELDPENPRKLAIDLLDIKEGIRPDDARYEQKQDELEKLKELAHTIKSNGIINPVVVYKNGELYRVVAGERRCLASILAGKQEIEARVFNEKPRSFELKMIQWIENTAREDLTLEERLGNIRDIIHEYQHQHPNVEISATLLKNITGLSLSQTTYYLTALGAPEDVRTAIQKGEIRNLDKAALIAGIDSADMRQQVMVACMEGASLKTLRNMVHQQKTAAKNNNIVRIVSRGRTTTSINMGATKKSKVVKTIVDCILNQHEYAHYADSFSSVDWSDLRQATKAFRKLIEILEVETTI